MLAQIAVYRLVFPMIEAVTDYRDYVQGEAEDLRQRRQAKLKARQRFQDDYSGKISHLAYKAEVAEAAIKALLALSKVVNQ